MGLLDHDEAREDAAGQAVRLAGQVSLPIVARSLTHEELISRQRRLVRWCAIGVAAILILLLAAVSGEIARAPWKVLAIVAPAMLLLGLPLLLAIRWHRQQARTYRDPGLSVRVDADGLIVANAAGRHAIAWPAIQARVDYFSGRGGIRFVGTTVESPLGAIRLDNDLYRNGRDAAAAVVRGMRDAREGLGGRE